MVHSQYHFFCSSRNVVSLRLEYLFFFIFEKSSFFRPAALLFGLVVIAVLLAGFVYSSRQQTALTAVAHDRPIVVLVVLLVASFFVIRMFGTVFIFLLGIAFPLACKSRIFVLFSHTSSIIFSDCGPCHGSYADIAKQGSQYC
jgi:hypothetical protein